MTYDGYKGQLELGPTRSPERDRNYHLGGRSFYFFDFDDNIVFLSTSIVIFHRETGVELALSSADWARFHHTIGKAGPFRDYEIRFEDRTGSFRHFRDHEIRELERLGRRRQLFVEDVAAALDFPDLQWKGPSWECFYHAAFNQRPLSLITARGHHPDTLKQGIQLFVERRILPVEPNYLSIFPVSNVATRHELGDQELLLSVAELKQRAIRASVEKAIEVYGPSPHHRFGMSDDDPKNIQLIAEEMTRLKRRYPEMSFFMIETHDGNFVKHEINLSGSSGEKIDSLAQLSLFDKAQTEV
ncbi:MAG: hypothetical protein KF802_13530 [Bdellovibrionaceae bacterium]|nr:hypothetical protein [Pseudobdellovibrionaceae bacterium]MBX3034461.1 hypothetical protein [Pseudobdellovibrionaceae bacterium]